MTAAKTWHLWRCDCCAIEVKAEHGDYAEPQIPPGWHQTIGWGVHACSEECRRKIQADHHRETGKSYLWRDAGDGGSIMRAESGRITERIRLSDDPKAPAKHAYIGQGQAFIPHPFIRGAWVMTHPSVVRAKCPQCGSPPGTLCVGTRGKHTVATHFRRWSERTEAA